MPPNDCHAHAHVQLWSSTHTVPAPPGFEPSRLCFFFFFLSLGSCSGTALPPRWGFHRGGGDWGLCNGLWKYGLVPADCTVGIDVVLVGIYEYYHQLPGADGTILGCLIWGLGLRR